VSVTLVYCGQTVGWIKIKLGKQVGLGPGHIVLDGDPAPPSKGYSFPIFGSYLLQPNACTDQDATWYGGRPQPRRLCVRWEPSYPQKKGTPTPTQFLAHVYCGQMAGWIKTPLATEVDLGPGHIVLDGVPALRERGTAAPHPALFSPCLLWPRSPISATAELL